MKVSRRRVICGLTSALISPFLLSGCRTRSDAGASRNQLNVYSWADYLHPDVIPEFERRTGVKVVYDTFASNEALLAKLQAGASDYDIVVPTGYMLRQLVKMKLLKEIEHDRIPNLGNIMERFFKAAHDPGLSHSVPYTWGSTGIAYNAAAIRSIFAPMEAFSETPYLAGERVPADWDVFFDARLSQRMTLLDDSRETIGFALKRRGYSYNSTDSAHIASAVADLKEQKPLVMCYTSDQVITQLASGDSWLSLVYSGDAFQAKRENRDVQYVIPISGASIWLDSLCIPSTAPHVENAYKWIDYILEPEVGAQIANYTRYATPNRLSLPLVKEELRRDRSLYPPEEVLSRCEEIGDVGRAVFTFDRMWTELKCT